ncbi:MAG TPA: DUF1684 domain-containing protein [Pyrinomonadaceae bacterium]|nr:DUF1684 domain-containing protein [Pyrinomonadaceae bacterium]
MGRITGKQVIWVVIAGCLFVSVSFAQHSFSDETRKWRLAHEEEIKADNGWLTVSGLFWLNQGINSLGSGPGQNIVLPASANAANVGTLELNHGIVKFRAADGVAVKINDETVREYEMKFDSEKPPAPFKVGTLILSVIKRGERFGLRVRDLNSRARAEFEGLKWFPPHESYRVVAEFTPYPEPKEITITNVLGDELKMKTPGLLSFKLKGRTFQLRPVIEDDKLFIMFRDRTAGKSTYGAGRFLYAAMPKDGKVILDFNRAENPPCAFTSFATCPLPPRQNRLPIAITAGELSTHIEAKQPQPNNAGSPSLETFNPRNH